MNIEYCEKFGKISLTALNLNHLCRNVQHEVLEAVAQVAVLGPDHEALLPAQHRGVDVGIPRLGHGHFACQISLRLSSHSDLLHHLILICHLQRKTRQDEIHLFFNDVFKENLVDFDWLVTRLTSA